MKKRSLNNQVSGLSKLLKSIVSNSLSSDGEIDRNYEISQQGGNIVLFFDYLTGNDVVEINKFADDNEQIVIMYPCLTRVKIRLVNKSDLKNN